MENHARPRSEEAQCIEEDPDDHLSKEASVNLILFILSGRDSCSSSCKLLLSLIIEWFRDGIPVNDKLPIINENRANHTALCNSVSF